MSKTRITPSHLFGCEKGWIFLIRVYRDRVRAEERQECTHRAGLGRKKERTRESAHEQIERERERERKEVGMKPVDLLLHVCKCVHKCYNT